MSEHSCPWWEEPKTNDGIEVAQALSSTVRSIRSGSAHSQHVARVLGHRALYENMTGGMPASRAGDAGMERAIGALQQKKLTVNVVRSIVDTATALVGARSRPKPTFLTSGGRFAERDRTLRANRLLEAIFRDGNANDVALRAFRDACVDDVGFVRIYAEHGRVRFERVDALTVAVSAVEGRNESPRTMYVCDVIDRGVLKRRFNISQRSALARKIDETPSIEWDASDPPEWREDGVGAHDVVRVFEAWRLPSGPDSDDGRHVICTEQCVLLDEPWERERFPIVAFRWSSRTSGFWGYSLAEEITPLQSRITHTLQRQAKALDRVAVPRAWVQKGTSAPSALKLDATIGQIVEYTGDKPVFDTATALGPEWQSSLMFLMQQVYDVSGVSRMSATAQKPAGLASGEALREYNDLAADRAMAVSRMWESFHVEMAKVCVDALADDETAKSPYIATDSRTSAMSIAWKDVAMDRARYVITAQPTSMLARDFASRKQQVTEMVQAGLIEPQQARRLLELPDIDRELDLDSAPRTVVERAIDDMLRTAVYRAPDPVHDLAYAVTLGRNTLALEEMMGTDIDEPGMECVRQYTEAAREMLAAAEAAAAPPPPAMVPAAPMSPDGAPAMQGAGGMVQ